MRKGTARVEDLARYKLIMLPHQSATRGIIDQKMGAAGIKGLDTIEAGNCQTATGIRRLERRHRNSAFALHRSGLCRTSAIRGSWPAKSVDKAPHNKRLIPRAPIRVLRLLARFPRGCSFCHSGGYNVVPAGSHEYILDILPAIELLRILSNGSEPQSTASTCGARRSQ